jgi:ferredoxin
LIQQFLDILTTVNKVMTTTYTVEILHQGTTHTLQVPDDQTVLAAAAAAGVDLPSSCNAGVCTTCAAQLSSGTVDQTDGMGISPELQAQGYALLCVAYPRSDLKIETEKEDVVYHLQFGQFQQK